MNPDIFKNRYNIEARVNQEVVKINRDKKTISVKDLLADKTHEEQYDTLVLSPGDTPIRPNLAGINNPHVFTVRNVVVIDNINNFVKQNDIKDTAVIGGSFICVQV